MTKEFDISKLPILRPKQVITLSLKHSKIQATFDKYVVNDWWVQSSAGNISLIEYATSLHISFVCDAHVFSGLAKVLSVSARDERVVLASPTRLKARPMRKHQRVKARLACAFLSMSDGEKASSYVRRDDGAIIDVSESGALVGCNSELPLAPRKLMMLFSIDSNDPYNHGLQLYIPGTIVRRAVEVKEKEFGFYYGIQFGVMVPTFQAMITEYIELNGRRTPHGPTLKSKVSS